MPLRRSDTMRAVDAVQPLVEQFEALDDGDKLTFLDLVDPLPDKNPHSHKQKKPANKQRVIEHCDACDYTRRARVHKDATASGYHEFQLKKSAEKKSPRASSLQQQISNRGQSPTPLPAGVTADGDGGGSERCQAKRSDGRICMLLPDHNIHHLASANEYHPFVSAAPDADGESPPQSEMAASAANSVTDSADVSVAAGG